MNGKPGPITKTNPDNPFRNSNNNLLGKQLFVEFRTLAGPAMYTLQPFDYKGCLSVYRLYMEMSDDSEYTFAMTYFDGWRHWESLCKSHWFRPYIEQWREELALKTRSEAIATAKKLSKAGGKDALTAAKYIAERGWEKKPLRSVGRPKKETTVTLDEQSILEDDLQRITGAIN